MGSFYDDDESIAESIIASATGYDTVEEAVNTLCEGSVAIDEAFEASTESLEEKVLEKALREAEEGKPSLFSKAKDSVNKAFAKKAIQQVDGVQSKVPVKIGDGKYVRDNKKIAAAAIGAGAASAIGAGVAIKHHLNKKKAQQNSQDAQQEAAEFGFYDATSVNEGVKDTIKNFYTNDGKVRKGRVAATAGSALALTGAGVAAVKGIKAHNKKKSQKAQNEAYYLQIGNANIVCEESALCDTDTVITGSLKEAYDEFRAAKRNQHIGEIAMESYLVAEGSTSHKFLAKKAIQQVDGVQNKVPVKIGDGKYVRDNKKIAAAAIGAAALTGAGIAAKRAHDKKKAQGKDDQQTNESVVYYSPYETYYDEAADCLTVAVYPPVAKLEGATLGLAGEVIPVDESTCYGYDNNYMDSFNESVEAIDEEYVFVLDEDANKNFFSKLKPSEIRKAIKAAAETAYEYMGAHPNVRKAAIASAFAAAVGGGAVVGHVITKKQYEKKVQNESYEELDDIIESVLAENGIKDKLAGFGDKAHTQALKIPGISKIVTVIDKYVQKCKYEGKANKPKIIAGAIAAALAVIGVTGIVLHGKKKAKDDEDATNEAAYAALEAFGNPF